MPVYVQVLLWFFLLLAGGLIASILWSVIRKELF